MGSSLSAIGPSKGSQLCIVPAQKVFEPNWGTGIHERWALATVNKEPFGLPGMWRTWEEEDGTISNAFTHFTLNADDHPLLLRFHRPNEEKRAVAILRPEHYDDWLSSKNPEFAWALIELWQPEELNAYPAPKTNSPQKTLPESGPEKPSVVASPTQADLF